MSRKFKWEDEFQLLWGIAPKGSKKYDKYLELKDFIKKTVNKEREDAINELLNRFSLCKDRKCKEREACNIANKVILSMRYFAYQILNEK